MMATVGDEIFLYKCVYLATFQDHLNTLKMILIKACDISNECRPIMVKCSAYERFKCQQKTFQCSNFLTRCLKGGWIAY